MKKSLKILMLMAILLPLFVNFSFINDSKADDPRVAKIMGKVSSFTEKYPQQKVYLHTDKDNYMAGETMWLKAYVLNASAMAPDSSSKDIYVELFNMSSQLVKSMILQNYKGFSLGDLSLSDSLMEGNYQLRAYTGWMRNFDPDFFFYKNIVIKNPNYENVVTKTKLKEIKQYNSDLKNRENEYHVTFFPEGGSLVAGLPCNVAFKAENSVGDALKIKGTVLDSKGTQVASFETIHDGMGSFKFTPQPGNNYTAQITYDNGKTVKMQLPEVLQNGINMSVDASSLTNVKVLIQSNNSPKDGPSANEIIIVGQSRGVITYASKGILKDKILSVIPKKVFPAGVAQITLFDYRGEPVCERLVFIDPPMESANTVKLTTSSTADSMFLSVKLAPANGSQAYGNFSLTMFENLPNALSSKENILTNWLLTSDLKGKINNPQYYFDKNNVDAAKCLDLVMMTNGWRRFVWKDILADKLPVITYPNPGGLSVKGRLVSNSSGTFSSSKVVLSFANSDNYKVQTSPDYKGLFNFQLMDFEDTVPVKVETFKTDGEKLDGILIDDNANTFAANNSRLSPVYYNEQYDKDKVGANTQRENAMLKKKDKGKSKEGSESRGYYGTASSSLIVGNDANTYSNVLQYMQGRISGVEIRGSNVTIRGVSSIMGSNQPLFLIDGVAVDVGSVQTLTPTDVERIDVLKGSESSMFGSRGGNGVIAFYLKHSRQPKVGAVEFNMVGYHKAREFYIPPYDSWTFKPSDYQIPKTAYWNPYVVTNSNGESSLRIKKKLASQKYTIVLEGITSSGDVIYTRIQY